MEVQLLRFLPIKCLKNNPYNGNSFILLRVRKPVYENVDKVVLECLFVVLFFENKNKNPFVNNK